MAILNKLDLDRMESLIKEGYIMRSAHPSGDLFIYNYTQKAVYEDFWTDETLQCRGMIADKEGNIVARPFPKFFNLEQHQGPISLEPFEVYEKLDGSLGILYFYKNKPYIASRGSFDSEQARVANEMLETYLEADYYLNKDYTYLVEIIYPENRIVVNYGDKKSLTLIGIIHTESGEDQKLYAYDKNGEEEAIDLVWLNPFPCVRIFNNIKDINEIANLNTPNKEGFVIRFESGLRLKIKFKDYVRLHSIVTQITKKKIWEVIKDNKNFDDFIGNIPDELYGWIKSTELELKSEHQRIAEESRSALKKILAPYRKEIAMGIKDHTYAHVIFSMLDNKDHHKIIWDILEPEREKPYGINFYKDNE